MLAASRGAVVESLHADQEEDAAAAAAGGAPELLALAEELKDALEEMRTRAGPLREAVHRGDYATKEGISYLDAKHLTLLSYCINICFYILLKAQASSDSGAAARVRDHPVVRRLLEARTYLEKARPIDKKMAYQLDRLLKMAADADKAPGDAHEEDGDDGAFDAEDPMQLRPNVGALLSSRGDGRAASGRGDGDGLYRPPKLVPARMDGGDDDDGEPGVPGSKRAARVEAERRRRAARSTLVRQLDEELTGAPQLVVSDLAAGGGAAAEDIGFIRREAARLQRRAAQEEDLFARVPMSKQERQRSKAAERKATGMSAQVADFADDVADVVTAVQRLERGGAGGAAGDDIPAPPTKRVKLSAIAAAAAVTAHNAHRMPVRPWCSQSCFPIRPDTRLPCYRRRVTWTCPSGWTWATGGQPSSGAPALCLQLLPTTTATWTLTTETPTSAAASRRRAPGAAGAGMRWTGMARRVMALLARCTPLPWPLLRPSGPRSGSCMTLLSGSLPSWWPLLRRWRMASGGASRAQCGPTGA